MTNAREVVDYLNDYLNVNDFSDYCPNGLQVEGSGSATLVGTAVSATLETLKEAVHQGVDVLIVHHGLFWRGDSPVVQGSRKEKLKLLIDHGITLVGYHLPLDAHQEIGNNWKAARDLGWENLEPFGEMQGKFIGVKGTFSESPIESFQKQLENYYDHEAVFAPGGPENVSSAALISGGAHRELANASRSGVDCFVTGSFDEPNWYGAKEEKIHFFSLGHSATERIGPRALGDHIQEKLGVSTVFIDVKNPF